LRHYTPVNYKLHGGVSTAPTSAVDSIGHHLRKLAHEGGSSGSGAEEDFPSSLVGNRDLTAAFARGKDNATSGELGRLRLSSLNRTHKPRVLGRVVKSLRSAGSGGRKSRTRETVLISE